MKIPIDALIGAALRFLPDKKKPPSRESEAGARARRIRRLVEDAVTADRSAADREAREHHRRLNAEHATDPKRRAEHLKRAAEHDIEMARHRREAEVARQAAADLQALRP